MGNEIEDIETIMPETTSCSVVSRSFGDLRGVQWRIDLGILPSSPSASVDDLRRVTANSRRRYAALRRQLLVDPHVPKDGNQSDEPVMDNPLSQNPDSMWGRFFRNAELEKMVDQDLTRLYPERGSYFQTSGCQGVLRRILLLWCLRHPEYGYRQGMHELLAPLLYVLHVDVEHLAEVRKANDDHFADKFDGFSFHENDLTYKFDFKKFSDTEEYWNKFEKSSTKTSTLNELDPEIQTIVLLCDAYGAEGELGILMSEKFMEHDAYSMFDALMSGAGGAVAMAEFYSPSPFKSSLTGFPPVIEASSALFHLLSIVDSSLHCHLVELGVEPQYFALRWLRLLFGREFSLEHLLVIWDEIFTHDNAKSNKAVEGGMESNFGVLESPRGAFIAAFAVSMILHMRSSLLATENATACLQRLLNFPDEVKLVKLISKAKSLQDMAVDANNTNTLPIHLYGRKSATTRSHSLSLDSTSPRTPLNMVPESYWEEKWRVLHKENENKQGATEEQVPNRRKGWSERIKMRLSRSESVPTPAKNNERTQIPKPSVRRSLLEDLERQLGEDNDDSRCDKDVAKQDLLDVHGQDVADENFAGSSENENESGRSSIASNSSIDENDAESDSADSCGTNRECSPLLASDLHDGNDAESNSADSCGTNRECSPLPASDLHDGLSPISPESSSVTSNSCNNENKNDTEYSNADSCRTNPECSSLPIPNSRDDPSSKPLQNEDFKGKLAAGVKEVKHLSGKFQWLWKFGRNANDRIPDKVSSPEDAKACNGGSSEDGNRMAGGCDGASGTSKGETIDQNVMVSFKNLGQSMLENIQVIESVFQQDRDFSKNGFVGKGQVTAMSALKELRKISNLLSEM